MTRRSRLHQLTYLPAIVLFALGAAGCVGDADDHPGLADATGAGGDGLLSDGDTAPNTDNNSAENTGGGPTGDAANRRAPPAPPFEE